MRIGYIKFVICICFHFRPVYNTSEDEIIDWSKVKQIADNNVTQKLKFLTGSVEIMEKKEDAGYQQFLLSSNAFKGFLNPYPNKLLF